MSTESEKARSEFDKDQRRAQILETRLTLERSDKAMKL